MNTRLLVFGVTHLGRGAGPEPDEALAEAVERIVRWRPDAIAIEVLPGELVDSYVRLGGPYAELRVGGLPQAVACAEAVASTQDWDLWQARTIGADRSRPLSERVTAWCAAYEPYTALLLADGPLDGGVRVALDAVAAKGRECWRIAGVAGRPRAVTGEYPGGRVLALVGHAHKGPLEAALRAGQWDLDLADFAEL